MTVFSTETELDRLLSSYGVLAFSDHENTGSVDSDVIDDCIAQASDELLMQLHNRYEDTAMATCNLVRRWTTFIAVYFLCMRRGNPIPESFAKEYERILKLIESVAAGHMNLPGISQKYDFRPTWSNLRVDRRWPRSKTRVKRVNSSDAITHLTQDNDDDVPVYDR